MKLVSNDLQRARVSNMGTRAASERCDIQKPLLTEVDRRKSLQEKNITILTEEVALLSRWLSEIEQDAFATRASLRWRIGDGIVGLIECLLFRSKPYLALDHLLDVLRGFVAWQRKRDIIQPVRRRVNPTQLELHSAHTTAHPRRGLISPTDVTPKVFTDWQYVRGLCNICGQPARFFFSDSSLYREQLVCEHCRSTSRYRSIARGILMALKEFTGIEAEALALLPKEGKNPVRIYDTQQAFRFEVCAYPIPDFLRKCNWISLTLSSYNPAKPLGVNLSPDTTNQNLERLTFADNSFDIVITSDVMEHVRLDTQAHAEIARVLCPMGIYLFTVPHNWAWPHNLIRVDIVDPGDPTSDVHLLPAEYHGDANSPSGGGVLAYRAYGRSLQSELETLGFALNYSKQDFDRIAIMNTELFYCQLGL